MDVIRWTGAYEKRISIISFALQVTITNTDTDTCKYIRWTVAMHSNCMRPVRNTDEKKIMRFWYDINGFFWSKRDEKKKQQKMEWRNAFWSNWRSVETKRKREREKAQFTYSTFKRHRKAAKKAAMKPNCNQRAERTFAMFEKKTNKFHVFLAHRHTDWLHAAPMLLLLLLQWTVLYDTSNAMNANYFHCYLCERTGEQVTCKQVENDAHTHTLIAQKN